MDGTSRHLVYFDTLQEDEGCAGSIETDPENMLSSHSVKRFFGAIWLRWSFLFRTILQKLFLWRLYIEKPLVIVLGLDTMVIWGSNIRLTFLVCIDKSIEDLTLA
jgi:hypothetical protein